MFIPIQCTSCGRRAKIDALAVTALRCTCGSTALDLDESEPERQQGRKSAAYVSPKWAQDPVYGFNYIYLPDDHCIGRVDPLGNSRWSWIIESYGSYGAGRIQAEGSADSFRGAQMAVESWAVKNNIEIAASRRRAMTHRKASVSRTGTPSPTISVNWTENDAWRPGDPPKDPDYADRYFTFFLNGKDAPEPINVLEAYIHDHSSFGTEEYGWEVDATSTWGGDFGEHGATNSLDQAKQQASAAVQRCMDTFWADYDDSVTPKGLTRGPGGITYSSSKQGTGRTSSLELTANWDPAQSSDPHNPYASIRAYTYTGPIENRPIDGAADGIRCIAPGCSWSTTDREAHENPRRMGGEPMVNAWIEHAIEKMNEKYGGNVAASKTAGGQVVKEISLGDSFWGTIKTPELTLGWEKPYIWKLWGAGRTGGVDLDVGRADSIEEAEVAIRDARKSYGKDATPDSAQQAVWDRNDTGKLSKKAAKVDEIALGIMSTNPGMPRTRAVAIARRTVQRFPKVVE